MLHRPGSAGLVIATWLAWATAAAAPAIEEVIVTATRMEESIYRVPLSVTAFSQDQLDDQRVVQLDDLFRLTPGVQFQTQADQTTEVSIRGIASDIGSGTTGIYIDDTPIQIRSTGLSFTTTNAYPELFDLERLEVLRGPQGTLFGAGSVGGSVRFITPKPNLREQEWYGRAGFGFTESGDPTFEVGLATGGPISEGTLGYRVSAYYRRDGGYVDRAHHNDLANAQVVHGSGADQVVTAGGDENANWRDNTSLRLAVTYAPTEALQITPTIYYQDIESNGTSAYWDYFSDPGNETFISGDGVSSPTYDEWLLPSLAINYDFESVSVISNTSYFDRENKNFYDCTYCLIQLTAAGPQPLSPTLFLPEYPEFAQQSYDLNEQSVVTQELRVQSRDPNAQFKWVIGAFYQDADTKAQDFVPIDAASFDRMSQALGFASYLDLFFGVPLIDGQTSYQTLDDITEKQLAGFTEVTYELFEGLKLTAGVRVTQYEVDATAMQGGPYAGTTELVGFTGKQKETATTPKFSIGWQANDDNLVYTTAAQGFRIGGVNQPLPPVCAAALEDAGLTSPPTEYESDEAWSYEVGSKNRFLDGRLSITTALFYIDWKDIPASTYLGLGCNRSVVLNAASATSKGGDLQAQMAITDQFTLTAAVGYTDAYYDDVLYGSPDPVTQERPIIINSGNSLYGVVPWTVALAADYRTNFFGQDGFVRLEYQYSSDQEDPTAEQDPSTTSFVPISVPIPSIDLLDVQIGVTFGNSEAFLFVDNVLDEHTSIQTFTGAGFAGYTQSNTVRPRTIGVAFYYRTE
jgi:iron complex outermembrane recepter protein